MRSRIPALALTVIAAMVPLAGCGDDDDSGSSSDEPAAESGSAYGGGGSESEDSSDTAEEEGGRSRLPPSAGVGRDRRVRLRARSM